MRFAFFRQWSPTSDMLGQELRRNGHEVREIVPHPGPPGTVSAPNPREPAFLAALHAFEPQVVLVATWPGRLPPEVIAAARVDAVNVHGSLLPALRGAHPEFWAIRRRLPVTGVTVHRLAARFDAGPVLASAAIPLTSAVTLGGLCEAMAPVGWSLVSGLCAEWAAGVAPAGGVQDEAAVTQAPGVRPPDLRLDWTQPAEEVLALVRACSPYLAATTHLRGAVITVHHALASAIDGLPAGRVVHRDGVHVGTADRAIRILDLSVDGKRVAPAEALLDGDHLDGLPFSTSAV